MRNFASARGRMVEEDLRARGIGDERALEAMGRVPRERFVMPGDEPFAYDDAPLSIGEGQTISQPYMVALICEQAGIRPGSRVLDVGTGSGYQAAVLAEMGAEVVSIERISSLVRLARGNLARAGYADRIEVRAGDGTLGAPDRAPFDAIVVGAAAPRRPETLFRQLAQRGRLVVPVGGRRGQRLEVVVSTPEGPAVARSVQCRFVPLVGAEGYAP